MKNINAKKFINLISIQYILIFILILFLICKKSQANDIIYLDCIQTKEYGGVNSTKKISIEINFTTEWAKVIGTRETYFKIRPTEKSILFMGSKKGKSEYMTGYLNRFTGVLTFF